MSTPIRTLAELVEVVQGLIDSTGKHVYAEDLQEALDRVNGLGGAPEIAWPQDAAGLIEMARDWPVPVSDGGDMFSGDVLIKKLGRALEAAMEPPTPVERPLVGWGDKREKAE